jgi:DNA gyrase subunit B
VRLVLADARHEERVEHELFYEGGIGAFVKYLDRAKTPLFPEPIAISAVRDGIGIDVALEWNDPITRTSCPSPTTSPSATAAPTWPRSARR